MKRMSKKQMGCSMMGGDGSTHAENIYGKADQQVAAAGHGNLIATMKGGYRKSPKSPKTKRGGSSIIDLAVPAVLLYGQQRYTRRSKKNASKRRFSRYTPLKI